MNHPAHHSAETLAARKAYYERIGNDSMTPLWEVLGALVPP
ncbi:MAG: gentisate 1,2-dioxygenase, partial [Pseudomonadota bacterium]